ncbi:MAG: Methylase involved in ubiquinone/menaquinone biosynthesis [Halomonas sp. HL-48]|nr:methyltransferase domain-containing protein [Halomonas sp. HL-48]KPQ23437.1 MAG: Methylase involved in ubiquinone/menaquinone biosynthesis [Halomonas sp. HL-48]
MSNSTAAETLAEKLYASRAYWASEVGKSLWESQRACLGPLVDSRSGGHSLEIGMGPAMMSMSGIAHTIQWSPTRTSAPHEQTLVCPADRLALPDRCLDVVVLHHWLEQMPDAHHVLQEATRVVSDSGILVLFGFNPLGISGLMKQWRKRQGQYPWNGQWRTANRMDDWLAFVDFEVERVDYCCFRSWPGGRCVENWESLGRRYNCPLGESYMVVAKRRQRRAPMQRIKFGLKTPVAANSFGATRTKSH